jgi:hypothetical protein
VTFFLLPLVGIEIVVLGAWNDEKERYMKAS